MMNTPPPRTLRVHIPRNLPDEEMPEFVGSTLDSFIGALDLETTRHTLADPHDVRVASVAVSEDAVAVNYLLPDPVDELGEQRTVTARRRGRYLVFQRMLARGAT